MADFHIGHSVTMGNEGGYANNPADRGGETWMGISRNNWRTWQGWAIVDRIKAEKPASLNHALAGDEELNKLVLEFYKNNFWDCLKLDDVECQHVGNNLYDAAVNNGTGAGAKFLQKAVNAFTNDSLKVDGSIGPKTIAAANSLDKKGLYDKINELRRQKYEAIIAKDSSQAQFKHSWFSRIKPYPEVDDNMA